MQVKLRQAFGRAMMAAKLQRMYLSCDYFTNLIATFHVSRFKFEYG